MSGQEDTKMVEFLDELTPQGIPTGRQVTRFQAHCEGIHHSCVHIWIVNPKRKELVLQRRAMEKESWPLYFDISCAGHVSAGEGPYVTCVRELYEELGLHLLLLPHQADQKPPPQFAGLTSEQVFHHTIRVAKAIDDWHSHRRDTTHRADEVDSSSVAAPNEKNCQTQYTVLVSSVDTPTTFTRHTLSCIGTVFQYTLVREGYIDNEHATIFVLDASTDTPDPSHSTPSTDIAHMVHHSSDVSPPSLSTRSALHCFPHPFRLQPEELHSVVSLSIAKYITMQLRLYHQDLFPASSTNGHDTTGLGGSKHSSQDPSTTQHSNDAYSGTPTSAFLLQSLRRLLNEPTGVGLTSTTTPNHASLPPSPPSSPQSINDEVDLDNPRWLVPIYMAPFYLLEVFGKYLED